MDFENGIVNILTPDKKMSEGIGFFISKNKILTCYHVIENYPTNMPIYYQYLNSNIIYKAKFVKANRDEYYDMALLEVKIVSEYSEKNFQIFDEKALEKIMEEDPKATVDTCGVSRTGFITYANPILVFKEPRKCLVQLGNFEEKMEHGFSGAPLLYHNKVIGLVKGFLKENKKIFYAIPTEKIIEFCGEYLTIQKDAAEESKIFELIDFKLYRKKLQDAIKILKTHYININCVSTEMKRPRPLGQYVDDFFQKEENKALLILGEYGSGKTSFAYKYALKLLNDFMKNKTGYIPIILKLNDYTDETGIEGLLKKTLQANYFKTDLWETLLEDYNIILICDGYDEIKNTAAKEIGSKVLNEIANISTEKTKIIVTCRPNHFIDNAELNQYFHDEEDVIPVPIPGIKPIPKFQEIYICELDIEQIKKYIESYKSEIDISVDEIMEIIQNTYDFADLSKRPILLYMIISTLNNIIKNNKKNNNTKMDEENDIAKTNKKIEKINAGTLYKQYINSWLSFQEKKNKIKIGRQKKLEFCKDLAIKLYTLGRTTISYNDLSEKVKKNFALADANSLLEYSHDIHSCSFLASDGDGTFHFIHKSFMEYFFADYIANKILVCIKNLRKTSSPVQSINKAIGETIFYSGIYCFINDILNEKLTEKKTKEAIQVMMLYFKRCNVYSQVNLLSILAKSGENMAEYFESGPFLPIAENNDDFEREIKNRYRVDFSYSKIEKYTYNRIKLKDFNVDHAFFYDIEFWNSDFYDSIFKNTVFKFINLENDFLENFNLGKECKLDNCDFSAAELNSCSFSHSKFCDCIFKKAKVEKNTYSNCKFEYCNFTNSKFNDCAFSNITFKNCDFEKAKITTSTFNKWSKCKFIDCDFTNANIEQYAFSNNLFIDCNFSNIDVQKLISSNSKIINQESIN